MIFILKKYFKFQEQYTSSEIKLRLHVAEKWCKKIFIKNIQDMWCSENTDER